MLGNIHDRRTDQGCPDVDAVFEPSCGHDGRPGVWDIDAFERDPHRFYTTALYDTTVREAILIAETRWQFQVSVSLYDKGRRPLDDLDNPGLRLVAGSQLSTS